MAHRRPRLLPLPRRARRAGGHGGRRNPRRPVLPAHARPARAVAGHRRHPAAAAGRAALPDAGQRRPAGARRDAGPGAVGRPRRGQGGAAGRRARDDQLGLCQPDTLAHLPRAGRAAAGRRVRRPGGPARTPRTRRVQPAPAAVCDPAGRRARPRRRPAGPGGAGPGPVPGGRQHRGARHRGRTPAAGRAARPHPRVLRHPPPGQAPGRDPQPGQRLLDRRAQRGPGQPAQGPCRRPAGPRLGADMQGAHMQGADVLIAVDVGTSGARASGFDVSGAPLDEVRRPYPTYLPAEGWAEQDARRWQSAALSALGALGRSLGPRARVRAVAVTGQCPSVVPLDRRDLPLGPGIIYRDNRATVEAVWMREKFGDRDLHELTGQVPAAFHVAAKIAWLRAHQPGVFAATRRFVQPTDWSMAAATALLDLRARRWAPELLAALDLDAAMLPAVVPSWSIAGEIRPKLARPLGLPAGVPVVAGAGDSIACALGAGVTGAGPVSEMAGSSSCFNSVVAEPLPDRDVTHYPSIT